MLNRCYRHELPVHVGNPHEWQARGESNLAMLDWRTEGYEQFYVSCHRSVPNMT